MYLWIKLGSHGEHYKHHYTLDTDTWTGDKLLGTQSHPLHMSTIKYIFLMIPQLHPYKHLKKSNAACFYTPIVLKLSIIVQMWKQHEEGN